jgi:ELWxxDGT repeat protein
MVKNINPSSGSYPTYLANVNGTLFFRADDGTNGQELWKSDGTPAGTIMVKDINPGGGSSPQHLTNVNGTLFFRADDGTHGVELWKCDGSPTGTVMLVKDINPTEDSFPDNLTNVNGTLFFTAYDGGTNGNELWKSDGTEAGTVIVKDINPGSPSSNPAYLANVNNLLFFIANDGTYGYELWMYLLNDDCQAALKVSSGQTYYGSNYGATGETSSSCAYGDWANVWYSFQPQMAGQYTIAVSSDEFDTTLALYNACGGAEANCNDDYNGTIDSQISRDMTKGKIYYIRVAGYDGENGNFELSVNAGACSELALSDLNGDCKVDMQDFAIMASEWLTCNKIPASLCQ